MGYNAGANGTNPSFDFFNQRPAQQDQQLEKDTPSAATSGYGAAALSSPAGNGYPDRSTSPLLRALGPRGGTEPDPNGGYGKWQPRDQGMGWQGGYGNSRGGGQQQFYGDPRRGYGGGAVGGGGQNQGDPADPRGWARAHYGSGGGYGRFQPPNNPYAPNPNVTRSNRGGYAI